MGWVRAWGSAAAAHRSCPAQTPPKKFVHELAGSDRVRLFSHLGQALACWVFASHFPAAVGAEMRWGAIAACGVQYSTVSAAFSHGCRGDAWGAQTSCPKAPSFGGDGPLGSPFLHCRCLPLPTFVSAVPCSQGINSDCGWNQVSDVMRTGCLPWGCGQVGSCPQLFFAPFPAGLCLGVAVSVRRR